MAKIKRPQPCECGCKDVWCVVDYGVWHIECAQCCRHTGPYYEVDNAISAWNSGTDVREPDSTKGDLRGGEQVRAMGAKGRRF